MTINVQGDAAFLPAVRVWVEGPNHSFAHDVRYVSTTRVLTREKALLVAQKFCAETLSPDPAGVHVQPLAVRERRSANLRTGRVAQ